jgi:hypothetical protein
MAALLGYFWSENCDNRVNDQPACGNNEAPPSGCWRALQGDLLAVHLFAELIEQLLCDQAAPGNVLDGPLAGAIPLLGGLTSVVVVFQHAAGLVCSAQVDGCLLSLRLAPTLCIHSTSRCPWVYLSIIVGG